MVNGSTRWQAHREGATWSVFTRVAIGVVDRDGERPGQS
ncbi:hypothetical protein UO65_2698 [Actinokineospora spheciospongiae]|uniref:Uncharacterized protein n=1 Tax=Actinokineospora spheciospongiae TaxID=909613 RepID=W7IYM3_9PSEU|nr:hypothetical protein UO65_2698 [Actinokineospora spheciospongiae]